MINTLLIDCTAKRVFIILRHLDLCINIAVDFIIKTLLVPLFYEIKKCVFCCPMQYSVYPKLQFCIHEI